MEKSFKEFTNSFLLTEEPLTEIRLFNRIKKWFKDISIKLLQKVKQLAVKGIRFILDFFEFQIDRIKTSGLEMFGYK